MRCDHTFDAYGRVRDIRLTTQGGISKKKMAQCPFCKCNNDVPGGAPPPPDPRAV